MPGETSEVLHVGALGQRRQIRKLHVLEHALAKSRHGALLGKGERAARTHPGFSPRYAPIKRTGAERLRRRQRGNQMVAADNSVKLELSPTAKRFSCVLGMFSSLEVKVPRPT